MIQFSIHQENIAIQNRTQNVTEIKEEIANSKIIVEKL